MFMLRKTCAFQIVFISKSKFKSIEVNVSVRNLLGGHYGER